MRHRNVLRSVIALGTSFGLAGVPCSSVGAAPRVQASHASNGSTFVVASTSGVQNLDPDTVTNLVDFQALGLVYDQLVRYNKKLQFVPDLAMSWMFSNGNRVIAFRLRKGVTFDDGSRFTSADVVASLNRVLAPKTGDASASYLSAVKSIVATGPYAVKLVLSRPDSSVLSGLTSVNLSILSTKAIAAGTVATKPDGTGPFVFSSWSLNNYLVLKANPHYWGGDVKQASVKVEAIPTAQLIASAIKANTVQLGLLTEPEVAKTLTGYTVQKVLDLSYRALMLQDKPGPLANVNNRRALECAISRRQIVNDSVFGEGRVVGPVPAGPFASKPVSALCPTTNLAAAKKSDVYIQDWLKGDFQAAFAWNGADPDPYTMYGRYFGPGADLGVPAGYSSPILQNLLVEGDESSSAVARQRDYSELSARLTANAVWVWLFTSYDYAVVGHGVHGFSFFPSLTDSLQTLSSTSVS